MTDSTDPDIALMAAASVGDITTITAIATASPTSLWYRDPTTGKSPLHLAALNGHMEAIKTLITLGHQWNAVDLSHKSAAEDAVEAGYTEIWDLLLQEGTRTELILALLGKKEKEVEGEVEEEEEGGPSNAKYLSSKLVFSEGRLLDDEANGVMMGWEAPLMKRHAEVIAPIEGLDVLNVGFGLGLVDGYLQDRKPGTHTIIEAHPDVYAKMIADGWDKKEGVKILFGRWQDVIDQLETYDGIFFDTFGEFYDDLREFHDHLPNILREDGIYSYFNGLSGFKPADLEDVGLSSEIVEIQMNELGDDVWNGVRRAYFTLPVYRLPICRLNL
ncbi:S-adenosyl-L-methionine-dependent methyltransferase [Chytridium lagenaria]|nr:S-adenosyl-L-methionine-dependent methyltransferase [Chytridium lagenaria]